MRAHNPGDRGSPRSTSVKSRTGHHIDHDTDDFEEPAPSSGPGRAEDAAPTPDDGAPGFLEGFDLEPDLAPAPAAPLAPPWPPTTSLTPDSYYNFVSLSNDANVAHGYGATALMCVVGFNSACYGTVRPGTIFLFPGTYNGAAPPYVGTPHIDCAPHAPLNASSGVPLHAQMCALLGQPTTNFIGFAVNYPLDPATMGYNSATCNVHWFGTRTLPLDWQEFVYDALESAISTSMRLTGRNNETMSSVQTAPVGKSVFSDDDVRLAKSATNGRSAEVAATQYNITINMSDDTVIKLLNGGFKLYAFKAVQTSQGGGLPTVWFTSDTFQAATEVTWEEKYQAYVSRSQIVPGGRIVASSAYPIDFGQTLEVGPGGTGTVTGQVKPSLPIFIENTVNTEYTCGISQLHDGKYTPLCALPLYGQNTVTVRPIERVLLMFATSQVNTGTVIEQSFSSGALIDLTTDVSREVTFEINQGWGPSRASWLTLVPSRTALDELLIEPPSAQLTARWAGAPSSAGLPAAGNGAVGHAARGRQFAGS